MCFYIQNSGNCGNRAVSSSEWSTQTPPHSKGDGSATNRWLAEEVDGNLSDGGMDLVKKKELSRYGGCLKIMYQNGTLVNGTKD